MPVIGNRDDAEDTNAKKVEEQRRLKKKLICSDGNWTAKGQTMQVTLPKADWEE